MITTRTSLIRIVAPITIVGALAFSGCSTSESPEAVAPNTATAEQNTAEGNTADTGVEIVTEDSIMSGSAELDAQLSALADGLRGTAADGVSNIMLSAYSFDVVGIQVWTDDEDGILAGEQLAPVLAALSEFSPVEPIGEFEITGWDKGGMQGEANGAAEELGVQAEFIDNDWWSVKIPGDQLANIFA